VFTQYLQQSKLIEGSMIYNNTEFYLQDNWKVNARPDARLRPPFTHQQPQYDQFLQMSNFFPSCGRPRGAVPLRSRAATTGRRSAPATRAMRSIRAPARSDGAGAQHAAAIGTVIPAPAT
jgi:hypothetical protein